MKKLLLSLVLISFSFFVKAQFPADTTFDAYNFTAYSVQGDTLTLFDTLDKGNTVIIDFFTTSCGPCHYYAPTMDSVYKRYVELNQNVTVWAVDKNHNNASVIDFVNQYSLTNPAISGQEGKGYEIFKDYANIQGYNFGTPLYAVVCPSKKVFWNVNYPPVVDGFDSYIQKCKTLSNETINETDVYYNIFPNPVSKLRNVNINLNSIPENGSQIMICDITGKIIYRNNFKSEKNISISLSQLQIEKGIYIVHVLIDNTKMQSQLLQIIE